MDAGALITSIVSGGVGASLGTLGAAVVQSRTQKSESRARAADLVTGAADRIIERLERENVAMRKAILLLTDVLDEMMPELNASPEMIAKLRKANNAARMAL